MDDGKAEEKEVVSHTPDPAEPPMLEAGSRNEIEPTFPYALVPGPARDTFLFYHREASSKDVNGLWDYCRFCISNLVWVNDHFVVTPNPMYLVSSSEPEERFAKIKKVLLNWYRTKKMVEAIGF